MTHISELMKVLKKSWSI